MSEEILSAEEIVARRIRRITNMVANRTDYGTFEDEESEHLTWLLEERARLQGELESMRDSVAKLTQLLLENNRGSL
jgi:ferritin